MALDNWFQNWHPPHFPQTFYEPAKNYLNIGHQNYHHDRKASNPNKFLPFFLSLNLWKPEKSSDNDPQQPESHVEPLLPTNRNYGHLNEDTDIFRAPLEYSKSVNRQEIDINGRYRVRVPIERSEIPGKDDSHENAYVIANSGSPLELLDIPNKKDRYLNKESQFSYRASLGSLKPITASTKGKNGHSFTEFWGFPDPFKKNLKTRKGNMTYEEEHHMKPLELTGSFKTWYRWKSLDFKYPSDSERAKAISTGEFVPENNLPLGIEVYKDRIFLSMPKWKPGVPATLAQLPRVPKEESPKLVPYPSWAWHSEKNCDLITSVFRMYVDECGRLWVLDSGKVSITTDEAKQHCPPKLLIFDLETDELLEKFIFPDSFIKEDSLHSNIVVDIRDGYCHDAYAYMADVWRFGLVVFRLIDHKAWRVTDRLFFPDPLASSYQLHHLKFEWTDGIFGTSLGPVDHLSNDRILYFHPMSSFREFYVKTSYLRDEDGQENKLDEFKVLGQSRGSSGHVSTSVMDKNGIMYYNLVTRDSIGCWDSRKPYKRENLGVIAKSKETLVFPNDMRLDKEKRQSMWIITNRLPYYLLEGLDISRINFRVMSAYTDESIKGTICDPESHDRYTYMEYKDGADCYF